MKHKDTEEILSLCELNVEHSIAVTAWTVRAVSSISSKTKQKSRAELILDFTMRTRVHQRRSKRSFIIYRREIFRLLNADKPARDQLMLELPCLMGFRSSEVANWRVEYIDFQNGQTLLLDAKKKVLLSVPLNNHVAKLAMKVIGSRREGYILQNRSRAHRGWTKPLTLSAIWQIWQKYAYALDLYPQPSDYSALVGRRFFAAEWYHKQKKSVVTLSRIMRHSHPMQTLDYVNRIIFAEDVKRDYDDFQTRVVSDMLKEKLKVKT